VPREFYHLHDTTEIHNLIQQLNPILARLTEQLQRIEGLDSYTSQFFGDIEHTGTNIGFFSATKAPQQATITNLSATPSDAEIQTAVNSLITTLETFGYIVSN